MKNSFWNSIKNGCSVFTLITVISYTVGMIISNEEKAYIPSLKSIYIYLCFSILFAFACRLLTNKKMNMVLRLLIHFIISASLFFLVIVIGGGLSGSGFATIIFMFAFAVIYLVFALIFALISKKKEKKANSEKHYSSLFN